eukprot:11186195-Lingulodinium_polyedra.AAC.1
MHAQLRKQGPHPGGRKAAHPLGQQLATQLGHRWRGHTPPSQPSSPPTAGAWRAPSPRRPNPSAGPAAWQTKLL